MAPRGGRWPPRTRLCSKEGMEALRETASPRTPPSEDAGALALRARPASARGLNTLNRILEATTDLAAEVGFEAVNTNLIAARAGVNIASVYKYFPNKQAIFATIAERMAEANQTQLAALIAQIDGGRPWRSAVSDGIRLAARRRVHSPGERAIWMAIRLSPELQGVDASASLAIARLLAGSILRRSGGDADRALLVARVAIEGVSGVLDLLLTEPASEAELLVQEATEAFVRYLEPWMEDTVTSDAPAPPPAGR